MGNDNDLPSSSIRAPLLTANAGSSSPSSSAPPGDEKASAADEEAAAGKKDAPAAAVEVSSAAPAAPAAACHTLVDCPIFRAIVVVFIYVIAGVIVFGLFPSVLGRKTTTNSYIDALYFSVSTLVAMGYGDANPKILLSWSFSIFFNLIGCVVLNLFLVVTVPAAAELLPPLRCHYRALIALAGIILPVAMGALVIHYVEKVRWSDSIFSSVLSITAIGPLEEPFKSLYGRMIASVWLLLGTLVAKQGFNFFTEELLKLCSPRTNFVTMSEFAIIMLVENRTLSPTANLRPFYAKFKELDRKKCGKVRLSSLTQNQRQIFSENKILQENCNLPGPTGAPMAESV